jgi:glycosyltransferase involved in cell wall biosynthesis
MPKIDIYWDLRATDPARHTGVGQHVIEVLNGLLARGDCDLRVLLAKDQTELWDVQSKAFGWQALEMVVLPLSNKGNRLLYGLTSAWSLDGICAGRDLVYSPMELILGLKRIPFMNTIHGMPCFEKSLPLGIYNSPRYRWERLKQAWFFRRCRQLCSMSFPVSDYLEQRLVQRFKFDAAKLHPVYNGAADSFFVSLEKEDPTHHEERPRLLSVGGANAFDGGAHLVQVARILEREMPGAKIWIVGDRHEEPWSRQLRSMPNVVWHGFLSSDRMIEAMRRATALLYVPAVESFGIIGVEAMATGLPVLAKQSPPLSEVMGDAACWFSPEDASDVLRCVTEVSSDISYREELIQKGRKRAERYRWSHVVERVVEGFQSVLSD